jgi:hypothetical protein
MGISMGGQDEPPLCSGIEELRTKGTANLIGRGNYIEGSKVLCITYQVP